MKALRLGIVMPLFTLAACAWWMAGRPGLGKLDQLVFSHPLHADNDVECATCHEGVAAATDTTASHRPAEEVCLECHERDDNCAMCHSDAENAGKRPARVSDLGFSHAAHMERVGDDSCGKCHPTSEWDEAPVPLPTMDSCLTGCHNHAEDYAQAECLHCHPSLRQQPLRAVAEFDHVGDWMSRHGLQARSQGASCQQCHTESTCNECHSRVAPAVNAQLFPEAVGRPLLHRGDWRSTHAIEARADGDTCVRCHHTNFCAQCHEQHGLTAGVSNGRMPHPPGWSTPGGAFHGDEARLRIETCAACHDQGAASNCVNCHKVGGIGGNPHPPGWKADDYDENPMCQACHTPGSE